MPFFGEKLYPSSIFLSLKKSPSLNHHVDFLSLLGILSVDNLGQKL